MPWENALLMKLSNDVEKHEIEVTKMGENYSFFLQCTKLYSFTLNRLETHLIYFLEVGIGTRIVSDKPIAFFSGHQCATIYGIRCGYLIEQLPPTSTWGTLFLGSSGLTAATTVTFYSVLAAHDETTVIVNCSVGHPNPATYTIDIGGNYHDFVIKYSSYRAFCVIEASKPVLVMEFQSAHLISDWNSFVTLLPARLINITTTISFHILDLTIQIM